MDVTKVFMYFIVIQSLIGLKLFHPSKRKGKKARNVIRTSPVNHITSVGCTQKPGIKKHRIFGISRLWDYHIKYIRSQDDQGS